jgi:putative DNA methylase
MSPPYHPRLIEDFLPIQAISAEASREKSIRKGHISTLHLWWARRPLVACRAAVYGALVPLSRFRPNNGPEGKRDSLTRANAARFVEGLCKYPGDARFIAEAEQHILEAHAERLTVETGSPVTVADIREGRAPRPVVLDMFAGGGAIPLEALRLGCDAYALDLNPVAHIIELCTLVYPQTYGEPDPNAPGMTGPRNDEGETTWGGLADEVRYWGEWVLEKVREDIGDLYPFVPDPEAPRRKGTRQSDFLPPASGGEPPHGFLTPVAYLWTRTVPCKNRANCGATVPLLKQTWLCRKGGKNSRYVAMRLVAPPRVKRVRFEIVESTTEAGLGFDPSLGSKAGNATCPFCGAVADSDYVKAEGCAGRIGQQMMAIACTRPGKKGKVYLSADDYPGFVPDDEAIRRRIDDLCARTGLTVPDEPIEHRMTGGICIPYGLTTFGALFTPRQMLSLLTFTSAVRDLAPLPADAAHPARIAVATYMALLVDRAAAFGNALTRWNYSEYAVDSVFGRQALPMTWDYPEVSVWASMSGAMPGGISRAADVISACSSIAQEGMVLRGDARRTGLPDSAFDAIVTDPPYYDNVDYAKLADFFYVWLKRSLGGTYPEHFAGPGTPKKAEAVADPVRHGGSRASARRAYEAMMAQAFAEAYRVLKPGGQMTVVYAHKTTLGWATLVDALRQAGFTVTEAWPLSTEFSGRLVAQETSALASSIFLVARKREGTEVGSYEDTVQPELERIVRERVASLWDMGIVGADLVIAAVGAGLRAFTRFERVEYANGEEVPAERFLAEVEGVVLEVLLERILGGQRSRIASVDGPSRFYILWRYTYGAAEMDAGEAIVFTYGQGVELDGQHGLSAGAHALIERKKSAYRIRDFTERGEHEKLGLPDSPSGAPAPLVDVLHRILWLLENEPRSLNAFLDEISPDRERLRLVAQALAGPGLKGGAPGADSPGSVATTPKEQSALGKLLANWGPLIESRLGLLDGTFFDPGAKRASKPKPKSRPKPADRTLFDDEGEEG